MILKAYCCSVLIFIYIILCKACLRQLCFFLKVIQDFFTFYFFKCNKCKSFSSACFLWGPFLLYFTFSSLGASFKKNKLRSSINFWRHGLDYSPLNVFWTDRNSQNLSILESVFSISFSDQSHSKIKLTCRFGIDKVNAYVVWKKNEKRFLKKKGEKRCSKTKSTYLQ